ncbi:MAG: L-seryl-tRNA(Sec) selenium transferase [Acidimicrobiia bacterium]|nr:L-seryl-tRNA(Sec) selenium transferase [Acidimicrobiia bacterium]
MVQRPPSVDALAAEIDDGTVPRALLVDAARSAIAAWRADGDPSPADRARASAERLRRLRPGRVINATGVLLHTNLGRAQVHPDAAEAARVAAVDASALEFDLTEGARGGRGAYAHRLAASLSGAEAALAVNNNAGALLLTLAALAGGSGTVVSRGELIEIGGSFRLPELMAASGSRLVEVGTTNRTRAADFERAVDDDAALLLKVHPSNYRVEGFTEEVGYGAMVELAGRLGLPFAADVGSGLLDARTPWLKGTPPAWVADEPPVRQTVEAGADVVMFSGDKLLGGPQAGVIVGRADVVDRIRRHPIARAVRIDGPSLAALSVTLELYASGRGADIPFWRMAGLDGAMLTGRLRAVLGAAGVEGRIEEGRSLPGAGSVPGRGIPGPVLRVDAPRQAWRRLVDGDPPVVARRDEGSLVVDLRAVQPDDDHLVANALAAACRS